MLHTLPSPVALLGIATLSCVMSAAVFGSLLHAEIPGLRRWFAAHAVLAVGFVTVALDAGQPQSLAVTAAAMLLVIGAFLLLQGCRQFFGLPASSLPEYALFGALLLGILHWTYVSPNLNARGALLSVFFAYGRIVLGWLAYRHRPPQRPQYGYYFVSVSAVGGALVQAARALAFVLGWEHQTRFLEPTPLNIAVLALVILTMPALSIGMVMLAHDRLAERMERLATFDELTGALTRRAFLARAERLLCAAGAGRRRLSIAILDIDNFKNVNDRYGHAAGDEALKHFVAVASRSLRHNDVFGRLGGEEFAVFLPSTGAAEAAQTLNRMRAAMAASPTAAAAVRVACTFSAGVDEVHPGDTLASVMARADAALYAAKAMGRNCVVVAPSIENVSVE